jgi:ABC-2 type transport system ATP-binding protein
MAIKVKYLKKNYGERQALKGVTITLAKGSIFGLLGPNGAGKSTLIKALVGALKPTSGTIAILGHDPLYHKKALRKKIGYMPQSSALYEDLSARENIRFFGKLQDVPDLENKITSILDFTELNSRADDAVYTLSGGMKKRVSLACALIHDPEILFLDEPTAAVDPHLKVKTWQLFKQLASQGITLFVSTHLMDEALLCDQLAIINQGTLIALDTPKGILEQGRMHLTVTNREGSIEETINGCPEDLAQALKHFGLDSDIMSVAIASDSLETIILNLLERKKI